MPSIGLNAPGEPLCDFCGEVLTDNSGACYFPARAFQIQHPLLAAPLASGDRWYACGTCRPLVDASDWVPLLDRTGMPQGIALTLWREFSARRTGAPVDVSDVAAADTEERRRSTAREQGS